MARHQHHPADTCRGGRAARFGDAGNGEPGGLGLTGARFKDIHARHVGIDEVELRQFVRQLRAVGQPGEAVFRRRACHRDRALGQRIEAFALEIVGRNDRLLAADDDAQAEIVSLGALRFLDRAVAHLDRQRDRANGQRVGLIGAGAAGGANESFGKIGEIGLIEK